MEAELDKMIGCDIKRIPDVLKRLHAHKESLVDKVLLLKSYIRNNFPKATSTLFLNKLYAKSDVSVCDNMLT